MVAFSYFSVEASAEESAKVEEVEEARGGKGDPF